MLHPPITLGVKRQMRSTVLMWEVYERSICRTEEIEQERYRAFSNNALELRCVSMDLQWLFDHSLRCI